MPYSDIVRPMFLASELGKTMQKPKVVYANVAERDDKSEPAMYVCVVQTTDSFTSLVVSKDLVAVLPSTYLNQFNNRDAAWSWCGAYVDAIKMVRTVDIKVAEAKRMNEAMEALNRQESGKTIDLRATPKFLNRSIQWEEVMTR